MRIGRPRLLLALHELEKKQKPVFLGEWNAAMAAFEPDRSNRYKLVKALEAKGCVEVWRTIGVVWLLVDFCREDVTKKAFAW